MADGGTVIEKAGQKLGRAGDAVMVIDCPGCGFLHQIHINTTTQPCWEYNGNPDRPTFKPSLLVETPRWVPPVTPQNVEQWRAQPWEQRREMKVCHSFITDGLIQFLSDSTHHLAGQTVDLPDWI